MNSTRRVTAQYLTVAESAAYLNTSTRFVRRLIAERRIAFHKVGSHVRIGITDLEAFVQAGRVEAITVSSVLRDLLGVA
ncbi:MAG: excisionase family DNA-binding protein [Actinomycetota bacterium]|nr:excisionase family DNA-binding protein [Actinomycetota bacterium]